MLTDSESFKFKNTQMTPAVGNAKDFDISVPPKLLSKFWINL